MITPLPDTTQALQLLGQHGRHFPESQRHIVALPNVTYQDDKGAHPVALDTYALSGVHLAYTNNPALAVAFIHRRTQTAPALTVRSVLSRAQSRGLVWGFSGFATPDKDYALEENGMRTLFACLRDMKHLPSLVCDGGVSDGVLGLSGVLAECFGVASLGYVPLAGLASIGPRTHLVAHKSTYREREVLVGLTPDILVCVGGGPGSQRECEKALENGGVVLLMVVRAYDYELALPYVYLRSPTLSAAAADGRLLLCDSPQSIEQQLPQIMRVASRVALTNRQARLTALTAELA